MKAVFFHESARATIRDFSKEVRIELGSALMKVQLGMPVGMPLSRPMSIVASGVHELRFRDRSGIQRVFYYLQSARGLLVFHAFVKKSQNTPRAEIELGRKRLREMLDDEEA